MTSQGKRVAGIVETFDDLVLGYTLKKLTEVFEQLMAVSRCNHPDNMAGILGMGQVKAARKIPVWLKRVGCNTPFHVTHVLIRQMNDSRNFKQDQRLEAQGVLLEALVEAALAMDEASYTQATNKVSGPSAEI
ncbi:hypothetical protein D3C81_195560 [compost metagenome]